MLERRIGTRPTAGCLATAAQLDRLSATTSGNRRSPGWFTRGCGFSPTIARYDTVIADVTSAPIVALPAPCGSAQR
jgi:hypothetical protein